MGKPIEPGFKLSWALMIDWRHAIASIDTYADVVVLDLATVSPSITVIDGASSAASLQVASAHGTAAALYYGEAHVVQTVTGLPLEPRVNQTISLEDAVTRLALSDDGQLLVYAVAEGGRETLYSWTPQSSNARFLTSVTTLGGLAIMGDRDAIIADRDVNEVFAIWNADAAATPQLLAGVGDGVSDPVGLAVSNHRIHIANAHASTILTLDSSGSSLGTQDCGCNVSGLYPVTDSVFSVTHRFDRAIFVLDATRAEEHIFFVPKPESSR